MPIITDIFLRTNEKEALQLELNKPTRVLIETILSQEAISAHE